MKNRKLNQTTAILSYLRTKRKSKMTAHQISEGVRTTFGKNYTCTQVSKCLNRFKEAKLVTSVDKNGTSPRGWSCYRWTLNSTK